MPELITNQVRAKSIAVKVPREDKYGERNPSEVRQHIIPSKGMFSAKEAEKIGMELAKELGVSDDSVVVETYKKGEAPMEVNPRHRGLGHHWDKRPSEPREVKQKVFQKVRTVFAGIDLPKTEEERQALIEEFEARKRMFKDGR